MKLLLDQGLPRSSAALLRAAGMDAVHTAEIGLSTAEDADILQRGRDDERVVVTYYDADFHALMALSGAAKPSVIRIRIEGLQAAAVVRLLQDVILQSVADLQSGCLASVTDTGLRVRKLPLVP